MKNLRIAGWIAVAALTACSGATTTVPGDCAQPFSACGGSVVGSWKSTVVCGNPAAGVCKESTSSTTGSLTIVFAAAGTFSIDNSGSSSTLRYPPSCFNTDGGLPITCAQLSQSLGTIGGSCTGGGAADCLCSYPPPMGIGTGGTWTAAGNMLTLAFTPSDMFPSPSTIGSYCVNGDTLKLQFASGASPIVEIFTRQ